MPELEIPDGMEHSLDPRSVLEALDREIEFNRKRNGQVFFFSLAAEATILIGQSKVAFLKEDTGAQQWIYTLFFIAIAVVGICLGSEYLRRIHSLKNSRDDLLRKTLYTNVFPDPSKKRFSEILVLYVVLSFLSTTGLTIVWLDKFGDWFLWMPLAVAILHIVFLCRERMFPPWQCYENIKLWFLNLWHKHIFQPRQRNRH